jgi:hypothetical protein
MKASLSKVLLSYISFHKVNIRRPHWED